MPLDEGGFLPKMPEHYYSEAEQSPREEADTRVQSKLKDSYEGRRSSKKLTKPKSRPNLFAQYSGDDRSEKSDGHDMSHENDTPIKSPPKGMKLSNIKSVIDHTERSAEETTIPLDKLNKLKRVVEAFKNAKPVSFQFGNIQDHIPPARLLFQNAAELIMHKNEAGEQVISSLSLGIS